MILISFHQAWLLIACILVPFGLNFSVQCLLSFESSSELSLSFSSGFVCIFLWPHSSVRYLLSHQTLHFSPLRAPLKAPKPASIVRSVKRWKGSVVSIYLSANLHLLLTTSKILRLVGEFGRRAASSLDFPLEMQQLSRFHYRCLRTYVFQGLLSLTLHVHESYSECDPASLQLCIVHDAYIIIHDLENGHNLLLIHGAHKLLIISFLRKHFVYSSWIVFFLS